MIATGDEELLYFTTQSTLASIDLSQAVPCHPLQKYFAARLAKWKVSLDGASTGQTTENGVLELRAEHSAKGGEVSWRSHRSCKPCLVLIPVLQMRCDKEGGNGHCGTSEECCLLQSSGSQAWCIQALLCTEDTSNMRQRDSKDDHRTEYESCKVDHLRWSRSCDHVRLLDQRSCEECFPFVGSRNEGHSEAPLRCCVKRSHNWNK